MSLDRKYISGPPCRICGGNHQSYTPMRPPQPTNTRPDGTKPGSNVAGLCIILGLITMAVAILFALSRYPWN